MGVQTERIVREVDRVQLREGEESLENRIERRRDFGEKARREYVRQVCYLEISSTSWGDLKWSVD